MLDIVGSTRSDNGPRKKTIVMAEILEKCALARTLDQALKGLKKRRTSFFLRVNDRVLCQLGKSIEKKIERPTPDKARPPPATRYKIAELLRLRFSAYNLEAL